MAPRHACVNCGDFFTGTGELCPDCRPAADSRRDRSAGGPVCPYCRANVDWADLKRMERRLGDILEVIYYCPACRAFLESASWMEVKGTGTTRPIS